MKVAAAAAAVVVRLLHMNIAADERQPAGLKPNPLTRCQPTLSLSRSPHGKGSKLLINVYGCTASAAWEASLSTIYLFLLAAW